MPTVKYRLLGRGVPPRRTKISVPGWAGDAEPRRDGSREQPWHCTPFSEGAKYGIEVLYPFENELRISTRQGRLILDGEFGPDPDDGFQWPPFQTFTDRFYTYQISLDLKVPSAWAIRTEPHPRFYTDPDDNTPIALPALLRTRWWPMVFFMVFKAPGEGRTHVFRPNEPFAQFIVVPEEPDIELVEMATSEGVEREQEASRMLDARDSDAEILRSRWISTSNIVFDGTYRHMLGAALGGGKARTGDVTDSQSMAARMTDLEIATTAAHGRPGWRDIILTAAARRGAGTRAARSDAFHVLRCPFADDSQGTPDNDLGADAKFIRTLEDLNAIASATEALAGDVRAYGPGELARTEGTLDAPARLSRLRSAAVVLVDAFAEERASFLSRQLAALEFAPTSRGLKLNFGSGDQRLEGWVNIDSEPDSADLAMDLRWGLPFADGSAELVFMSHVLEHLYYPTEALMVLKDIRRVLSHTGALRIIVPDIEKCIRAYAECNEVFFSERRKTWTWWPEAQTRLEDFLSYAGVGADPAAFSEIHKFGYDFETLRALLGRAGFRRIDRSTFMRSRVPGLRIDDHSLVAGAKFGANYYSLFVDASP
jgi:predicted SAM-dependent methyltransferase